MLPPKYMGAVMVGNGFCAIIIGVLRLITLLIFPNKEDAYYGTLIYFCISAVCLIIGAMT